MKVRNFQHLVKQAQEMQERLTQEMSQLRVEATSGGGMVSVSMDGGKQALSLSIDPEVIDPEDVEMLQDLILAALNEATRKVDEALNSQLGGLSGGLLGSH